MRCHEENGEQRRHRLGDRDQDVRGEGDDDREERPARLPGLLGGVRHDVIIPEPPDRSRAENPVPTTRRSPSTR